MQEEGNEDCRALLAEQRALANEYHTSIWRSVHFFSALITALLGLSVVLIGSQAPRILVITFPLLALLFSIFGIIVLYRGSRYFLQATYAISVIRNRLKLHPPMSKRDLKTCGIDDLLCDRFASAEEYVKQRSFSLTRFRIRAIIYWIYIILAVMSLLLIGYLIFLYR